MVLGDHGPAIGQQPHVTLTGIDHRLDGEGHAGPKLEPCAGFAVVQHLRVLVIDTADAMATVLAHYRVVVLLDEGLNGVTDVAEMRTGTHGIDAAPHGSKTGLGEPLRMGRRLADEVHAARVAVEAITDHGDIDIDDVARLQTLVVRDAVAHHVIDRSADGLRKPAVIQVRGDRALHFHDMVVADTVELLGRHSGHHVLADHVEDFGGELPGNPHFLLLFRGLDGDVHKLPNGAGGYRRQEPAPS